MNRFALLGAAAAWRGTGIVEETMYLTKYLLTFGIHLNDTINSIIMAEWDASKERAEKGA